MTVAAAIKNRKMKRYAINMAVCGVVVLGSAFMITETGDTATLAEIPSSSQIETAAISGERELPETSAESIDSSIDSSEADSEPQTSSAESESEEEIQRTVDSVSPTAPSQTSATTSAAAVPAAAIPSSTAPQDTVSPVSEETPISADVPDSAEANDPTDSSPETTEEETAAQEKLVWVSANGSKYHKKSSCSNMKSPWKVTISEAKESGLTACKKCY